MAHRLEDQLNEYHLRIEDVLSGMDSVLVKLGTRLRRLECRVDRILKDPSPAPCSSHRNERLPQARSDIEAIRHSIDRFRR